MLEVSLVRKGAREACYVTAYEEDGGGSTRFRNFQSGIDAQSKAGGACSATGTHGVPAWACFDLS